MHLTYLQPLWWLLALLVLGWAFRRTLVDRPRRLMLWSFALRCLAVVFLVLALCRPGWMKRADDVHVVFLVDVSQSVDLKAAEAATARVKAAIAGLGAADSSTVFAMGNGVRPVTPDSLQTTLAGWGKGVADDEFRSASRLADAALATRLAFPAGKSRRLVLLTDGMETHGSIESALATLRQEKVDVVWNRLDGLRTPEAAVIAIEPATTGAFVGEIVRFRIRLQANQQMQARLHVTERDVKVVTKQTELFPDRETVVEVDIPMLAPGKSVVKAQLETAAGSDHFTVNNESRTSIDVMGKSRILVIHRQQKDMRPFARALQSSGEGQGQDFEVDVRGEKGLPDTMDGLLAFHAIVLADVPATEIPMRQMELLKSYVQDFGGGLVMTGSENSFGLGGYYKTPVEDVLPLVSRFEKEKERPSLAMVLVIDKSGSMEGLPIQMARQAAKASVELLGPNDQVAVIGFDSEPQLISDMRRAAERDAIQASIDSLEAGGGTNMFPAMQQGAQLLDACSAKVKHMICLTDGQTSDEGFAALTQSLSDSGVTVSTVALGDGAAGELLQQIAEIGKGRFYAASDPANVPQIFTRETMQASKSAIKEGAFRAVQTADHPMMAGYTDNQLPESFGYVMTEAKPATQVILSAADTGDPLLAAGRFGLGQGLAFTSDLTEKWGFEWLGWDGCGKFWAQVFRSILRKADVTGMEVRTLAQGDEWKLDIRRRDDDGTPVSNLKWDAFMVDENNRRTAVPISETGLGRYTGTVPLAGKEQFTLTLRDMDSGKLKILHWNRPSPPEYRLGQDPPAAVAALKPFREEEVRTGIEPVETRRSLEPWCYFLALGCALGSIVMRRV